MAIRYVSKTARNGFAVGNNGTAVADNKLLPYLTIAAAVTACEAGDEVVINDGTWGGAELGAGSVITIGAARIAAIRAANIGKVTFNDWGATQCILGNSTSLGAGAVLIQGINFRGDVSTRVIEMPVTTNLVVLTIDQCVFDACWTTRAIHVPSGADMALIVTGCTFNCALNSDGVVFVPGLADAGSYVTITGNTIIHPGMDQASENLIIVTFTVAAGPARISDNTITVRCMATSGTVNILRVIGGADNRVSRNVIDVTQRLAPAGTAVTNAIWLSAADGTAIQTGAVIADNHITMRAESTGACGVIRGINFGTSTNAGDNLCVDARVLRNRIEFDEALRALGCYGVLMALQTRAYVAGNVIHNASQAFRLNTMTQAHLAGNFAAGVGASGVYLGACVTCSLVDNVLASAPDTLVTESMVRLVTSGTHVLIGNTFVRLDVEGQWKFINSPASTSVIAHGNRYAIAPNADVLTVEPFTLAGAAVTAANWAATNEPDSVWGLDPYLAAA